MISIGHDDGFRDGFDDDDDYVEYTLSPARTASPEPRATSGQPGPMLTTTKPNRCPLRRSTRDRRPPRPGTAHLSNRGAACSTTTSRCRKPSQLDSPTMDFMSTTSSASGRCEEFSPPPKPSPAPATGTTAPIRTTHAGYGRHSFRILAGWRSDARQAYRRPSTPGMRPAPPSPRARRAGSRSTPRRARSLPHTVRD